MARSDRPSNGSETFTVRGLHAFFVQWLTDMEKFHDERDRRYTDKFDAQDQKTQLALDASEKAVTKAEIATEKRFEGVNEFRATLSDQATNLMPRKEAEAKIDALNEKIEELKKTVQDLQLTRSEHVGSKVQEVESRGVSHWTIERILMIVMALAALGVAFFK